MVGPGVVGPAVVGSAFVDPVVVGPAVVGPDVVGSAVMGWDGEAVGQVHGVVDSKLVSDVVGSEQVLLWWGGHWL